MADIATAANRIKAGTTPADASSRNNDEESTPVIMDERDLFLMVDRDDGNGDGDAGTAATLAQVRKAVTQGVFISETRNPANTDKVAGLPQVWRNGGAFHFHSGVDAEEWVPLGSVSAGGAGITGVITEIWFGSLAQYNNLPSTKNSDGKLYFTS